VTKYCSNKHGLAMGFLSSAVLSEIYLQYIKSNIIIELALKHKLLGYFRYVDDTLLVYDHSTANINYILRDFNQISQSLHFSVEMECNKLVSFLDLSINRLYNELETCFL
jgi:hypothetical protein